MPRDRSNSPPPLLDGSAPGDVAKHTHTHTHNTIIIITIIITPLTPTYAHT